MNLLYLNYKYTNLVSKVCYYYSLDISNIFAHYVHSVYFCSKFQVNE